jgi:hypothetical protein
MSPSERTSHSVMSAVSTVAARSRTLFSIRSPWYVKASLAPPAASTCAIAQAIERLLATPRMSARLPSNAPAIRAILRYAHQPCAAPSCSLSQARRSSAPHRLRRVSCRYRTPDRESPPAPCRRSPAELLACASSSTCSPPLDARRARSPLPVARRKLDLDSSSSRAYLRRLDQQQARAAAQIRAAIPQARIGRRFQVVLDDLTVSLPASKLPGLVRLRSIDAVYPSVAYTLALDRSPSVIGADVLRQQRGADGTGMKIAVVDDGIDQSNVFFDPKGFSYPPGFPRGSTKWTTPKVIVARS